MVNFSRITMSVTVTFSITRLLNFINIVLLLLSISTALNSDVIVTEEGVGKALLTPPPDIARVGQAPVVRLQGGDP